MEAPQTPIPPRDSNPRRGKKPSLLSPSFSRSAFPAAAAGDHDADVSEHPCVALFEWWLASVEGDDQKIAVAGVFERNQNVQEFAPALIAKRHEACILETEDGIVLLIHGSLNMPRMRENGYSITVCEKFLLGFPYWWQSCNLLFPKMTNSHTGCQPTSSYASNSEMDSKQFYLERFQLGERLHSHGSSLMSKFRNSVNSFSHDDAAFQKSSYLPNGAPRFEEYTCDGDIATNENAAASNNEGERHESLCNEVDNVEIQLTAGRALRERDGGDIDTNASLVLTMECANDAGNKEADNAPPTSNQVTPVASLRSQGCWRKSQHVALSKKEAVNEGMPISGCFDVQNSSYLSNGTPRFEEYTCDGDTASNENTAASHDDGERDEAVCNDVDNVELDLTAGRDRDDDDIDTNPSLVLTVECATDASNEETDSAPPTNTYNQRTPVAGSALCESDHGHIDTNVSLAFTSECANDAGNEKSGNAPPTSTCEQRTPVVSLKAQGCQEKTQRVALSKKAAVDEKMPTSVCLAVQNPSYLSNETPRCEINTCVDNIPTNGDAAALNDNSERCSATEEVNSMEIGLVVASTIRERGHDDITTNVSLAPTVECINDAVNEGVDNNSLLGCRKSPVVSLKSQACQEKHQHIPSNEKPSGPPKKQRSALEKLQGATVSPLTSPVSCAHESLLSRGRSTLLSMSTPEALKLRKTRSGRVVVPTLDAGCQRIVYDVDGTIAGVIGLDSPSSKGSKLKTYARKKREAESAAGSKMKTYARKKRRTE